MSKLTLLLFAFCFCFAPYLYTQEKLSFSFYFERGLIEVNEIEKEKIAVLENRIVGYEIQTVQIHGYCDDIGSFESNLKLSTERAENIQALLNPQKFPPNKVLKVLGKGEIDLIQNSKKSISEQRKQNRRVDILIECTLAPTFDTPIVEEIENNELQLDNKLKVGDKVTLRNILFIGGRDLLMPESYEALDELIFFMKRYPEYSINILGHICCQPDGRDGIDNETELRNLSVVRAKRIYDILVEKGISKSRLDYKGMKGNYPTGLGDDADRRVEIEISDIQP